MLFRCSLNVALPQIYTLRQVIPKELQCFIWWLMLQLAGTVVFLVFGSQAVCSCFPIPYHRCLRYSSQDVLRVWSFWRRDDSTQVSPTSSRGSSWANLDLTTSPRKHEFVTNNSVTLRSPLPAHIINPCA